MSLNKDKIKRFLEFKKNPEMALFKIVEDAKNTARAVAENEIKEIRKEFESRIAELERNPVKEAFGKLEMLKGKKGDRGDSIKGDKGDRGDGGKDGNTPIVGIDFPFPENGKDADDEKIIKEVTKNIPKPENGKDGSPDKGEDIVKKINTLPITPETQIDASHIKNLPKAGKVKKKGGGGMGDVIHETFDISAGTTSIVLANEVAANGNAIMTFTYQNARLEMTNHYTVGGDRKTITFNSDVQAQFTNDTVCAITYIR